jgi:predicted ABC-type ATPase
MAVQRVAARVRQGGHDVPEGIVRRRFTNGLRNFHDVYAQLADEWSLYDNAVRPPQLLAAGGIHAR